MGSPASEIRPKLRVLEDQRLLQPDEEPRPKHDLFGAAILGMALGKALLLIAYAVIR